MPWDALLGGMLLGTSASLLLLFKGKIAGISGIVSGLFTAPKESWRWGFLIGLIGGGFLANAMMSPHFTSIPQSYSTSYPMILLSGLLVGMGTKLANGCTSGHGICGIGRFSIRSIFATLLFMFTAAIVVYFR